MISALFRLLAHAGAVPGLLLLGMSFNAAAETRYVTDILQLSLYEEINSGGELLKRLSSGTELELLETSGLYARVRTSDGVEGWTKAGFLIAEKPARGQLADLKAEIAMLEEQLKTRQQALDAAQGAMNKATESEDQALAEMAERLENAEKIAARVDQLEQENAQLREEADLPGNQTTIPVSWSLIACGLALLLGIGGGIALFDYRSRKRHGGYRIY